ncbi:AAA family ATPase [Streptomyces sp. NRRL WC-3626]|uniref:AAA family ATPase n=1 Tax=Streptomyces sp. NRRL WC-3626 TaxID=1463926 RepID=UPI0004BF8BFC|nr:AAA family ATPase [Streptomyces sp. NRRL WC-3626]
MTTNTQQPPADQAEGCQENELPVTPSEARDLSTPQSGLDTALTLFDWLWDDRPGWVCLATDHRIRDLKSGRKSSDFRNAQWYRWPEDREKIPAYAEMVMNSREVWFTPALLDSEDRKAHNATVNGRICQVDADHTDEWDEQEKATRLALLKDLNAAVVKSGTNGNFHAYVKLDRDTPREVIDRLNAQLTAAFAGDSSKENASSVLRFPGTFNHKTDPSRPVVLETCPEGFAGWDPAELARTLPEAQETPTGGRDEAAAWVAPDAPDSLAECRTLADLLSMPTGHPERSTWPWLQKVAGHESRAEWLKPKPNQADYIARVISHDAASDSPRLPYDEAKFFEVLEHKWEEDGRKNSGSKIALAAQLAKGEIDPVEAVESWSDFNERVFDDVAGIHISNVAQERYYGPLLKLAETDPEAFDATPFARTELLRQINRARAEEKAKVLAAPGNKELGRPSRRKDCTGVVYDATAPGLFIQPGWITLFMADYEVGKTMLAYSLAADRLRKGEEVVVIQEDEAADQTWGKVDAFCLTEEEEDRFQPYNYQGWNLVATPEMLDALMERHPRTTLLIVDSIMKITKLAGLEEDNPGAVALWTVFERFAAKYPQVAVLLIDHQGHNGGGHARGATGKAQMSSVVLQVSSVAKFARDRNGQIKVKVHKHRNGESTGHTWRGDVIVRRGDEPFRIEWADEGVKGQGGGGSAEPDGIDGIKGAELGILKLLKPTLGSEDVWITKTEIDKADKRHATSVTKSIGKLIDAGYLAEKPGWKLGDGPKSYRRLK